MTQPAGYACGTALRRKCVSLSYLHVGINVVTLNMKTCTGNCTPHKDRDILVAIDEFLMCAFEICDCSSLYKEKQKSQNVREKKHLSYILWFLFLRIKTRTWFQNCTHKKFYQLLQNEYHCSLWGAQFPGHVFLFKGAINRKFQSANMINSVFCPSICTGIFRRLCLIK